MYHLDSLIDKDRNLYFVKLVAGRARKRFETLIRVTSEGTKPSGRGVINFVYGEELLSAWAETIQKLRAMAAEQDPWTRASAEEIHEQVLATDTVLIPFAHVVAFSMTRAAQGTIVRGKTRFELADSSATDDQLILALMHAVSKSRGAVRRDLQDRFL